MDTAEIHAESDLIAVGTSDIGIFPYDEPLTACIDVEYHLVAECLGYIYHDVYVMEASAGLI